ncbi:hypothetical protein [Streptomyces wuyuanensis]|uniref:hypothetical protein n=1 Tax=Streptomyces wuyuanensis TaxID=1196353 RepID=UPI0036B32AA1
MGKVAVTGSHAIHDARPHSFRELAADGPDGLRHRLSAAACVGCGAFEGTQALSYRWFDGFQHGCQEGGSVESPCLAAGMAVPDADDDW